MTGRGAERLGLGREDRIEDVNVVSMCVQLRLKWDGRVWGMCFRYYRKLSPALGCQGAPKGTWKACGGREKMKVDKRESKGCVGSQRLTSQFSFSFVLIY